jgi:hypothetical protein
MGGQVGIKDMGRGLTSVEEPARIKQDNLSKLIQDTISSTFKQSNWPEDTTDKVVIKDIME